MTTSWKADRYQLARSSQGGAAEKSRRPFLLCGRIYGDRVDAVRIKRHVVLDGGNGIIRRLISPDGIDGAFTAGRNAEVAGVALVRAIGGVAAAFELAHVDVLARDVLDRRIGRFAQRQRVLAVGDDAAGKLDGDAAGGAFYRDRMVGAGDFDGFGGKIGRAHVLTPVTQ